MIHQTAIIDKETKLGSNVSIGAYSVIEKGVVLGDNIVIGPYAHLKGDTRVGSGTFIATGAVIGEAAQMLGEKESIGKVYVGENNIIREYVTVHSSASCDKTTYIGDNNFLMAFSHIAHDCRLENNIVICNGTLVAGHVEIGDRAFISGNVVIHQNTRIGRLSMIGGLSRVNQDVPPFMMVLGDSRVWGINLVGLKRAGFSSSDIFEIKKAFKIIYGSGLGSKNAIERLRDLKSDKIKEIIDFLNSSKRGVCGPKRSSVLEKIFLDYPYFIRSSLQSYSMFSKARNRDIRHKTACL